MTNKYYQKHKERRQKEAHKTIKISEDEKDKRRKNVHNKIFVRNKSRSYLSI